MRARAVLRACSVIAVAVALGACAGTGKRDVDPVDATAGLPPTAKTNNPAADVAAAERAGQVGDGGTALAYDPRAYDPWEKTNRRTHRFNRGLDRAIMKPVARTYVRVLPSPVRSGIGHFFNNLQQPVVALNLVLQGHPGMATKSVGRFVMNLTLGIAGVFDPATKAGVPYYKSDFGETFAQWGWDRSRYLVLPVFGPSTVRDGFGRLINSRVSPINTVSREVGPGVGIVYGIHSRASALPSEVFMENAEDDYLLLRDVYYQRRACQIRDCTQDDLDYALPEELGVED